MKTTGHAVGDTVEMMCSACDMDQSHTVRTATKQGVVTQAACDVCEMVSSFTRGVKTSFALGKGKSAAPYDRSRRYRKGQAMTHEKFGRGEVTAVIEPQKIDVFFGDQTRRLIHAQS